MQHRTPFARIAVPAFALVAFAMTGCTVDNSGGEPPAGDPIEFEIAIEDPDLFCDAFEDAAELIVDADGVDAFIEACGAELIGDESTIADDLNAQLSELEEGEGLLIVSAQLGGCLGAWEIAAVHLDGDILRPWMLKADSSYGRQDVGCTADIGQDHRVLVVDGADEVASVELTVGIYNPDLPGAPSPANEDQATD